MKIKIISLLLLLIITFSSCNYLDIVPDERATEQDAFKDPVAAERFLYACYAYIPDPRHAESSIDLLTGDDIVTPWEHEVFGQFARGEYTPTNPYINYWNDLFKGIRYCYMLKENVASVPGMVEEDIQTYQAEADFLIAFYHYLLIRTYGPCIIVRGLSDINTAPADFLGRSPYDECVTFTADMLKEVAGRLPMSWTGSNYGRATGPAAMAIRARLLLYAASPQFNGGEKFKSLYGSFKNPDGTQLISTTYDPAKWTKAKEACKEAIEWAEQAGCELYKAIPGALSQTPEPEDLTQRSLRFTFIDKDNTKEVIWASCRKEATNNGLQPKNLPRWNNRTWGGTAVTLRQVERFYTKNGLPIDEDPTYPYTNRYGVTAFEAGTQDTIYGEGETIVLNTKREPRFYAWVCFHHGYYEAMGEDKNEPTSAYYPLFKRGKLDAKILMEFMFNQNGGKTERGTGCFTGFLAKKGVHPGSTITSTANNLIQYPWPIIRLGELYLNYAEACIESGDLDTGIEYLDKIRERAGIPGVKEAWEGIATLDQNKLREIVHRERQIELFLENHNFWDLRRWGEAESLGEQPWGMSVMEARDLAKFGQPAVVDVRRRFIPAHYLMPLPIGEINKNPNLVQNPGYNE